MGLPRSFLLVFSSLVLASLCKSEFVPVYMWGTQSTPDAVPALHKVSQSSFKDEITSILKNTPTILVFAEQSLSPEDFGQRDSSRNVAFPNLSKVRKTSKVTYLSYVQNPIKAIKHASNDVSEISIERLTENFEIPESKVVIIELNDASENEDRFDMLKRHDELITSIYDNLLKKHDNVLALYTAHHASWIESGEEVHSRSIRSLSDSPVNQFMDNSSILFYTSGSAIIIDNGKNKSVNLSYNTSGIESNSSVIINGTDTEGDIKVGFQFIKSGGGYWYLQSASFQLSNVTNFNTERTNATVYAPLGFSYACVNQSFKSDQDKSTITFPHFQVQPMFKHTFWTRNTKFDDPYNCVGFTSIPIWSGLFVTFILLLIMTFGLTMMMDIKTMDRFDDPKGKTITINTSE